MQHNLSATLYFLRAKLTQGWKVAGWLTCKLQERKKKWWRAAEAKQHGCSLLLKTLLGKWSNEVHAKLTTSLLMLSKQLWRQKLAIKAKVTNVPFNILTNDNSNTICKQVCGDLNNTNVSHNWKKKSNVNGRECLWTCDQQWNILIDHRLCLA